MTDHDDLEQDSIFDINTNANFKEIIPEVPMVDHGYVYLLINNQEKVVYAGSTKNIYARLNNHLKSEKIFYKIRFWEIPLSKMIDTEVDLILSLNPLYNVSVPTNDFWLTLSSYIKINPIVKGKAIEIRKILHRKGWQFRHNHLKIEQWHEVARLLEIGGKK